jgi:integrase
MRWRYDCSSDWVQRDWHVFELLRVNKPRKLPVVLSTSEVRTVLGAVRHPVRRTALTTIYSLGLRLGEGLRLETDDIDSKRLMVWVRDGKGAKDRGVSLPRPLLARLRRYWQHDRPTSPTKYLFVSRAAQAPLHETTLQKTFVAVRREVQLKKHASIHTLRHSSHVLRPGVCPLLWEQPPRDPSLPINAHPSVPERGSIPRVQTPADLLNPQNICTACCVVR